MRLRSSFYVEEAAETGCFCSVYGTEQSPCAVADVGAVCSDEYIEALGLVVVNKGLNAAIDVQL
jgi:hypothetical protein